MSEEQPIAPVDDPLGILRTAHWVVTGARAVAIDPAGVERVAGQIATREIAPPAWDRTLHWIGQPDATANYVLALDALNFSFWGEPRWVVSYQGERYNGYWALAASLTRALNQGVPLDDAAFLAEIDAARLGEILAGEHPIPLLEERAANLREVGRVLLARYGGLFSRAIAASGPSAVGLVELVVRDFPSFRDVANYHGVEVRFYKRAQILVSDLYGAFAGTGLGAFPDIGRLTAFADYKVPQVLEHLGVLVYTPALAERIARLEELPAGGAGEVEIRAATICSIERLRRALANRGRRLAAFEIDWALWSLGQQLPGSARPYHRTRTIFY
ncbi:MAG TPA: queuosine salvage family protein [Thermomicrobiaceae bacterium]|nr:queuosine salvage family protein [Thermomicrobiaceae bacterium]